MQLHNITQHYIDYIDYMTLHYHYNCNYNYHYIVLHYANHTTPQLQLQLRYTNYTAARCNYKCNFNCATLHNTTLH